jgi:hypothetical protein
VASSALPSLLLRVFVVPDAEVLQVVEVAVVPRHARLFCARKIRNPTDYSIRKCNKKVKG